MPFGWATKALAKVRGGKASRSKRNMVPSPPSPVPAASRGSGGLCSQKGGESVEEIWAKYIEPNPEFFERVILMVCLRSREIAASLNLENPDNFTPAQQEFHRVFAGKVAHSFSSFPILGERRRASRCGRTWTG